MKSIKEKAEEYSFIKQGINSSGIQYRDFNLNKQEGFKAGANYVLEQVENIVLDKNTGLVEMWSELMTLIEQLKK